MAADQDYGLPVELQSLYDGLFRSAITSMEESEYGDGDFAHPVFGFGDVQSDIVLIGEAPGAEEATAGRPFVGKAGIQLDDLLSKAGIRRERVFITNVVKYRPISRSERSVRNRTPSKKEIEAFLPLLQKELVCIRPRLIATLGNTPLFAALTLAKQPIQTIGALHGRFVQADLQKVPVTLFPMYHPASGIYNRSLIPIMEADVLRLGEHLVKQV